MLVLFNWRNSANAGVGVIGSGDTTATADNAVTFGTNVVVYGGSAMATGGDRSPQVLCVKTSRPHMLSIMN